MSKQVSIQTALCLPAPDIEALIQGQIIAAIPRIFLTPGRQFALYPSDILNNVLPPKQYYHSRLLPSLESNLAELANQTVFIKAWARCEFCQDLDETVSLESLSKLTIWTTNGLQETLWQRQFIRLAYLRVYLLSEPLEVPANKSDKFVALPHSIRVTEANPVLSDRLFTQRRRQLAKLEPPLHPELEELQAMISQIKHPAAQQLDEQIQQFLGWTTNTQSISSDPKLTWIKDIKALGERSKEQDSGKSNYQAGTDFEIVVRDSLEFLGFTVDYSHKGGAGGLDLFCSKPYPLVGECKAGRKIPNDTAVQLLNLGTLRLKNESLLKQTVKLIIGPGEPTPQLADAAKVHGMSIINPETLEKLVKLQALYRNSIDLFKLKEYLKPGQADQEVEKYITQVETEIKLRSHIVTLVKNHLETTGDESAGFNSLHVAYLYSNPPQSLKLEVLHEILIELSSPLTGYLGRSKGRDGDRFYFLRELQV
ncbi:MAG: DUF1802 family protein [Coleofasciculaceae cyanobacterium]